MKLLAVGLTFFAAGLISAAILLCGGIINTASANMEASTWMYVLSSKQAMPFFVLSMAVFAGGLVMTLAALFGGKKK